MALSHASITTTDAAAAEWTGTAIASRGSSCALAKAKTGTGRYTTTFASTDGTVSCQKSGDGDKTYRTTLDCTAFTASTVVCDGGANPATYCKVNCQPLLRQINPDTYWTDVKFDAATTQANLNVKTTKCLVTGMAPHAAANLDFTYFHSIETTAASTADFWDVQSAACKTTTPTPAVKSAGSLLTVASTTTATTLLIAATLSIVALC